MKKFLFLLVVIGLFTGCSDPRVFKEKNFNVKETRVNEDGLKVSLIQSKADSTWGFAIGDTIIATGFLDVEFIGNMIKVLPGELHTNDPYFELYSSKGELINNLIRKIEPFENSKYFAYQDFINCTVEDGNGKGFYRYFDFKTGLIDQNGKVLLFPKKRLYGIKNDVLISAFGEETMFEATNLKTGKIIAIAVFPEEGELLTFLQIDVPHVLHRYAIENNKKYRFDLIGINCKDIIIRSFKALNKIDGDWIYYKSDDNKEYKTNFRTRETKRV